MIESAVGSFPEVVAPVDCPTCGMPLHESLHHMWRTNASVPKPRTVRSSLWHCRGCRREFIVSRLPRQSAPAEAST